MNRRLVYGVLSVALSLYVFSGAQVFRLSAADDKDDAYQQLELFSRVLERVRRIVATEPALASANFYAGRSFGDSSTNKGSIFLRLRPFAERGSGDTSGAGWWA